MLDIKAFKIALEQLEQERKIPKEKDLRSNRASTSCSLQERLRKKRPDNQSKIRS